MAYQAPTISASGITFGQWQQQGVSGHLESLITANVATSNPVTAPTVSAAGNSTAGGLLAAGGYLAKFTEGNGVGETLPAPESAAMTVATAGIPLITFPALQSGNQYRNLYLTPANGAANSEVLYANGLTANTYSPAAAAITSGLSYAQGPPPLNTTGLYTLADANGVVTNEGLALLRLMKKDPVSPYINLAKAVDNFNSGNPIGFRAAYEKFRRVAVVFSVMKKLCDETGVLLDANPGTFKEVQTGIGGSSVARTWP